ncbi:MAG TPA: MFS transporter [Acidobacteriaceae bacterium]|nr:MFS transporter [Acidobacteriaceae bacterium]
MKEAVQIGGTSASGGKGSTVLPGGPAVRHAVYAWVVVGLLWLVCFFSYADRQALFSVFPLLRKEMGLTSVQLGMLGSSFAVIYGLSGPFAGYVVDHIRRKTAILGGLELWSVICCLSAVSRNFAQLVAFRACEGLGESIYYPAALSMVSDYHGSRSRSRAMGILQTSVYAGTVGGGYWAGVIAERHGWRPAVLFFGGAGCLLGLVLIGLLREPVRGAADSASLPSAALKAPHAISIGEVLGLLRIRSFVALMAVFACANFVALVLLTWMPTYLYSRFHLSLAAAALDAAVYPQLASMVGSVLGGYLADAGAAVNVRSRLWVQTGGVLLGAPFVLWSGLSHSLRAVIAGLVLWGLCKGVYDSNIFAAAFDVVPIRSRGTVSGLMNCIGWLLGGGAAPLAIGFLAMHISLGQAIASSAIVYVIAGMILLVTAAKWLPAEISRAGS